jgi:hypothetical protein
MPYPVKDRRMMFLARFEISVPDVGCLGILVRLERAEFPVRW